MFKLALQPVSRRKGKSFSVVFSINRSGFLVFLLNDNERPNSLFVLTNDIAVFKPTVKGEAIHKRIIAFGFIFAPTLEQSAF